MGLLLLWLLVVPLPLLVGVYLIWRHSGILRNLGWLIILVLVYHQRLGWISPWYVIQGGERVQEFKLHYSPFGPSPSVRWIDAPHRLLLVPDERVVFIPEPPEYNYILVADLETRQTHWQPKAEVNLDDTQIVMNLSRGYIESHGNLSVYYASPSKVGLRTEYSFVGLSLPHVVYQIPWIFSEASGWGLRITHLGWSRLAVRESESGPVVVELNQIVFNSPREVAAASTRLLPGGKFLIVEPPTYVDPRVFALGPFNTSQDTHSTDNSKEK